MSRKAINLLAIAAMAMLASACSTDEFFRALYDTGKNMCEESRSQCDDHAGTYGRPVTPIPPSGARPNQLPY
jgi:hypothetical protein